MAKCDVLDHSLLLIDLNGLNYVKIIIDHITDFSRHSSHQSPVFFDSA
jgi:hypothetical protein